jgi:hypothetical protein
MWFEFKNSRNLTFLVLLSICAKPVNFVKPNHLEAIQGKQGIIWV